MHAIHRSRRFGRLLAAWLLLWFVVMSAAPLGPLSALGGLHSAASIASEGDVDDCGTAAHQHHDHDEEAAQPPDGSAASPLDVHAGHGAGSLSHCPLCLHGAAPPPVVLASSSGAEAPAERPAAAPRSVPRTRTDVPPPARGPPALS